MTKLHGTIFAIAPALALMACSISTEPSEPPPQVAGYAQVGYAPVYNDVPADYYNYPHTDYQGRTTYFVRDHWYYRTERGWQRYEVEPAPLTEHRRHGRVEIAPAPRREGPADRRDDREREHEHEHEHERR